MKIFVRERYLVDKGPERFQEKGDCSIMCDSGTKGRRVISVYGVVNSVQSRLLWNLSESVSNKRYNQTA
jgi:hypothetical protein